MPNSQPLMLASENPQELIELMLGAADSQIDPGDSPLRRGFHIALDAVSTPQPGSAGEPVRPAAADGHEFVELLLSAAVAKTDRDDHETRPGVEVALAAVLSIDERAAGDVLAERFAAAAE